MVYRNWTDEELKQAVKTSLSKTEILKKLGLSENSSGNYQTLDKYIKILDLDISHLKSKIFGKAPGKERDITDILVKNSDYTATSSLKKKLLKFGLLENKCYGIGCGIVEWHGTKLSLQLDHINGDRADNRIENLRLLCPNCHSITSTFCRGVAKQNNRRCIDCGQPVTKDGNRCIKCNGLAHRGQNEKIQWPDLRILRKSVIENGFSHVGRKLGVSDNAVRKHICEEIKRTNSPVRVGIYLEGPISANDEAKFGKVPERGFVFSHKFTEFSHLKTIKVIDITYSGMFDCIQILCVEV